MATRELVKVGVPGEAPLWFQAVVADLNKTLGRMQQQMDEQGQQLDTLQKQVDALS